MRSNPFPVEQDFDEATYQASLAKALGQMAHQGTGTIETLTQNALGHVAGERGTGTYIKDTRAIVRYTAKLVDDVKNLQEEEEKYWTEDIAKNVRAVMRLLEQG